MSWHKITLPIPPMKEIDPKVVEIGDLAKACYAKENKPAGFGMFQPARFGGWCPMKIRTGRDSGLPMNLPRKPFQAGH